MDEDEYKKTHERLVVAAAVTGSDLIFEAAAALQRLFRENTELKDRVWSSERRFHQLDEWEAEDA